MLIDSHAHLDMEEFEEDLKETLERALNKGLTHIITVGNDMASSLKSIELAETYDFIFSAVGCHPHNVDGIKPAALKDLLELTKNPNVVAWGEIGLDFFKEYSPRDKQLSFFIDQMKLANEADLPVIIHDREAHEETMDILKKYANSNRRKKGVIHCFTGDYDLAMEFIRMGYYISVPGIVTYKNARVMQDVASRIPLENMLVETDSPYLAPVPKRGKRNEPSYVAFTAMEIAKLRNIDFQHVANATSENTKELFGLA